MKPFAPLLTAALLLSAIPVMADYNAAGNVQQGYVDSSDLTLNGTTQGVGYLTDGLTATGSEHISGESYPSSGGSDPNTGVPVDYYFDDVYFNPSLTVDFVNLYSALWSDGGWFGTSAGVSNGTLSSTNLAAPVLQYSTDNGASWTTVATHNDYVTALTGAAVGPDNGYYPFGSVGVATATSVESTFVLDTPITGATDIRLVGTGGGTGTFISGYEMQIEVAPEPSTYAMIFGGMGMLALFARLRRKLSA